MSDLRSLHRAISFAESHTGGSTEPGRRPQSAGALTGLGRSKVGAPWLAAPPPRPDNAAALARWVQRRLAPFSGPEAEVAEAVRGHEAAAWHVSEVVLWLRCSAGLEQYSEAFAAHGIGGRELLLLDELSLLELGVRMLGHRKRLLHAIDELRQRVPSAAPAVGGSSRETSYPEMSRGGPSHAPAPRQRAARQRQHIAVLEECMQRVLAHCASLPLHSRQLLLSLWHEQRQIALEALAATEAQAEEVRQRERAQVSRRQARIRARLELLLAAHATSEDRAEALERRNIAAEAALEQLSSLRWDHQHALIQLEGLKAVHEDHEEARSETLLLRRSLLGHTGSPPTGPPSRRGSQAQAEALELAGQMAAASLALHQLIAVSESEQEAQLPLMEHAEEIERLMKKQMGRGCVGTGLHSATATSSST